MSESALFLSNPEAAMRLRRSRLAEQLLAKGASEQPIQAPTQGLARMANSLLGGFMMGSMEREARDEREKMDAEASQFSQSLAGLSGPSPSSTAQALAGPPPAAPAAPATQPPRGGTAPVTPVSRGPATIPDALRPAFEAASAETGIPIDVLAAKVAQESGFNPGAVGRAGEIGLAQVLPSTARDPGFGMQGVDPETLRDPAQNVMFGARYLAARGRAAGVTDWNNPEQLATGLRSYNGGGDPNYAQNVMRYLPTRFGAIPQPGASPDAMPASMPAAAAAPQAATNATPVSEPQGVPNLRERMAFIQQGMTSSNPRVRAQAEAAFKALQLEAQTMQRDGSDVVTLAPGGALVNRRTGQTVAERPPAEQQPRTPERFSQDQAIARAGSTNIQVGAEQSFARRLESNTADALPKLREAAISAEAAMRSAARVEQLLSQPAITGALANQRLNLDRALTFLGIIDGRRVVNTQELMSEMASATLRASEAMAGVLTDRDIEFLKQVVGGDIRLEAESIRRISRLAAKQGERTLNEYNDIVGALDGDPNATAATRQMYRRRAAPGNPDALPAIEDIFRGADAIPANDAPPGARGGRVRVGPDGRPLP